MSALTFELIRLAILALEQSSNYLLRVAVAIKLVLDAEFCQNVLIERIVLVLQLIIVIDANKLAPFDEHFLNNHSKAIIS